ncbi:MFS transporter [Streptomyces longwoodensis]|uniref:MFS transporter n=1 Tax=Streptomyces longwoodensis TaxID=68231 RepID=UPI0033C36F87
MSPVTWYSCFGNSQMHAPFMSRMHKVDDSVGPPVQSAQGTLPAAARPRHPGDLHGLHPIVSNSSAAKHGFPPPHRAHAARRRKSPRPARRPSPGLRARTGPASPTGSTPGQWTPLAAGLATLPLAVGATVCALWSGRMVGSTGPRRPLLLGSASIAAGALCLVGLTPHTSVLLLLAAYLFIGIGFGFANAPITNTAVNGLPPARAGVAGAITSTARQLGAALGIALAGGLATAATPSGLAHASRPG